LFRKSWLTRTALSVFVLMLLVSHAGLQSSNSLLVGKSPEYDFVKITALTLGRCGRVKNSMATDNPEYDEKLLTTK
jgi:hypothetical protein